MTRASEDAKARVTSWIKHAERVQNDADRHDRLAGQQCKACYYASRLGGQAITRQACMSCHAMQTYSSTDTDALCMGCATQHDLCKHCGGDIKMRVRRKGWPTPSEPEREISASFASNGTTEDG